MLHVHERALAQWLIDDDASSRDRQRVSLAAAMRTATSHLNSPRSPHTAMLDTAHAIRHAAVPRDVIGLMGPLADRARHALLERTTAGMRLENWDLTTWRDPTPANMH